MKDCRPSIMEFFCIRFGLVNRADQVKPFLSLYFDMNTWQPDNIRDLPVCLTAAALDAVSLALENLR